MKQYATALCIATLIFTLASLLQPSLFKILPSDFSRTSFLLKTLNSDKLPEVAIFGNSIAMSCIDASTLSHHVIGNPSCYNLASNGQLLSESCLYYPMIKPSTKLVIQMVRSSYLEEPLQPLSKATLRNFYFSEYNFEENIEDLFHINVGLGYIQNSSSLKLNYDQRGTFVNAFNKGCKNLIKPSKIIHNIDENLIFPSVYEHKVIDTKLEILIQDHNPENPIYDITINPQVQDYFINVKNYFKSKGVEFLMVVYPYNALLDNYTPAYKKQVKQALEDYKVPAISLMDTLIPEDFVDDWHVSKDGAQKLSISLAKHLNKMGYAF